MKTKHPQLLYESKLYKILQGGSESLRTSEIASLVPWRRDECSVAWECSTACALLSLWARLLGWAVEPLGVYSCTLALLALARWGQRRDGSERRAAETATR